MLLKETENPQYKGVVMKSRYLLLLGTLGLFFILFSGCYTQLGTVRDDDDDQWGERKEYRSDDQSEEEEYTQRDTENYGENGTTIINNYYYDDWYPRWRVGFSYYYPSYYWPSYAFSVAYYDPWLYDYYWHYDPWWCGTPYVRYGGYWYPPVYYYPVYGYSTVATATVRGGRNFGNTRSATGRERGAAVRTEYENGSRSEIGTMQLPTGARVEGNSRDGRDRATQSAGTGRGGTERVSRPRDDRNSNGRTESGTRDTRTRERDRRNVRETESPAIRNDGSSRNTTPTYTPPSVRTPSGPPATGGGGNRTPSNTGSRGSNTRSGGRR